MALLDSSYSGALQIVHCIVLVTARVVNLSFAQDTFPEGGKIAMVKPILKKPTLDPFEMKSWHPISNTEFVPKLVERIAIQRFNSMSQIMVCC